MPPSEEFINRGKAILSKLGHDQRRLRILECLDKKRRKKEAHKRLEENAARVLRHIRKEKPE